MEPSAAPTQHDVPADSSSRPWTRAIWMDWRPNPRVYDQRSSLVEALEAIEPVERFRFRDGDLTVTLESGHEIRVEVTGLGISTLHTDDVSPEAEGQVVGRIIDIAAEIYAFVPRSVKFWFQHLLPLQVETESEYEVFAVATHSLLPGLAETFTLHDFALLANGVREGRLYQFEAGVIDADSAPERLARIMGRTSGRVGDHYGEFLALEYPKFATFVDTSWSGRDVASEMEWSKWVCEEMSACDAASRQLAEDLHTLISRTGKGS